MEKVLVIIGPTAVGKTALSIEVAKLYNGEIINGDSVQVYKCLDIGSAKITKEEMSGIKHHLIDILPPSSSFSVAEFQSLVRQKITEITSRGKLPIICGGTGLYIQGVLYDFNFENKGRDEAFSDKYKDYTNQELHLLLAAVDKPAAEKIHYNNRSRVLRALEILENSSVTKTLLIEAQEHKLLYDALIIGLDMDRAILYERINERVQKMMEMGLEIEVRGLYEEKVRVNAIGYKEFYDYFENKVTINEVIESIQKNTRNYAKRQLTYFRNKLPVKWFDVQNGDYRKAVFQEISDWTGK